MANRRATARWSASGPSHEVADAIEGIASDWKFRRRLESKAKSFRSDPQMEQAIRLRGSQRSHDNAKFDALPPSVKLALGYYVEAKQAAAELGLPTS